MIDTSFDFEFLEDDINWDDPALLSLAKNNKIEDKKEYKKQEKEKKRTISDGNILLARKLLDSDIMLRSHAWFKLWIYILLQAKWKSGNGFERGEFFTSYRKITEQTNVKKYQIQAFIRYAKAKKKLTTQKTTRGMVIKVLKYEEYQNTENYKNHTENQSKSIQNPHYNEIKKLRELKKEKYKKEKINFKNLDDFVKEKIESKNKIEKLSALFCLYSGFKGDLGEFDNSIRQQITQNNSKIHQLKHLKDDEINLIFEELNAINRLSWDNAINQANKSNANVSQLINNTLND